MKNFASVTPTSIGSFLNTPKTVCCYEETTSTNLLARQAAEEGAEEGALFVACSQTAGRGRRGKSFFSPNRKGIYFSFVLRPHLAAKECVYLTVAAAVAVRRALFEVFGIATEIKWVNDIYANGKKLCGILAESSFVPKTDKLRYAVVGIGINLEHPDGGYPQEFAARTTSVRSVQNRFPADAESRIVAACHNAFFDIWNQFPDKAFVEEYKQASCLVGKDVFVLTPMGCRAATVLDIDHNANLVIREENGKITHLSSGDVSIRL